MGIDEENILLWKKKEKSNETEMLMSFLMHRMDIEFLCSQPKQSQGFLRH